MSDTPETDKEWRHPASFDGSERVVHISVAQKRERERDEAREERDHWKTEYEIVVARLCGNKHPRDNGIISEHEIIPKLTQERDEAREALENHMASTVHSCSDECKRPMCVLRRERDEARKMVAHAVSTAHQRWMAAKLLQKQMDGLWDHLLGEPLIDPPAKK